MTRIVVRMLVSAACIAAAMMPVTHAAADDKDICNSRAADDQAIAACNRLIDSGRYQGRDLVTAYLNRGAKWSMKGDHDRAIADYDEMIRLDPKISQAYNNRGISWRAKGNLDRATADFSQAIGLDPTLPQAYQNRATVWRAIGDHDRAIGDLDRAIALGPDNAEAYNDRGASWRAKGDMTRAIADLDRAIKLDPKSAKAYTERGGIWLAKRDNERAFAELVADEDALTAARADPVAQERQERRRDELRREHVRLEHPAPVVEVGGGHRVEPFRAARVVHQQVDAVEALDESGYRLVVGDVELPSGATDFGREFGDAVDPTRADDNVVTLGRECARDRFADT
mgnify:CR=1 FL=1